MDRHHRSALLPACSRKTGEDVCPVLCFTGIVSEAADALVRVRYAYLHGRDRPPCATYVSSGWHYEDLLSAALADHYTDAEANRVSDWRTRINDALHAARLGALEKADVGFKAVEAELENARGRFQLRLVGRAFLEPGRAYLWYRRGDYDAACRALLYASFLDQVLSGEYGLTFMACHRLQLGLNLVRISARRGHPRRACEIAGSFLDYLEHAIEAVPDSLASPRALLTSVPESVIGWYFDRFCGELASVRCDNDAGCTREWAAIAARHADAVRCSNHDFGVHGHAWLRWKRTAFLDGRDTLLRTAPELLRFGRSDEPKLWFSTVTDVTAACRRVGRDGACLADWMTADAAALDHAPAA